MKRRLTTTTVCIAATTLLLAGDTLPAPEEAFQQLQAGNARFASGKRECLINLLKELKQFQKTQTPYAAILCCSDSRIPPELVFDESLGKLFIIRIAGNIATDATIGSIEYAVAVLKVPLVVVLGHEQCGVLITGLKGVADVPPFVRDLINETSFPVMQSEKESTDFLTQLKIATVKNVQFQMQELIEKSETLRNAINTNQVLFKGGVFQMTDGSIQWCPCNGQD
jgi:carbonic anhydrase